MDRLDLWLYQNGFARSRTHAANLIKLGRVLINGKAVQKAGMEIRLKDKVKVIEGDDFASLGGIKLKKALDGFSIDLNNKIAVDIGASNGGFTDVMLKAGAKKVYAVDVAKCALPKELTDDERVVVKDCLNARYLTFEDLGIFADFISIDVSFISLTYIVPCLIQFLKTESRMVALIKPQFEVGKAQLTKNGIVKSKKAEKSAVKEIEKFFIGLGFYVEGILEAPHPFAEKNQEYLISAIWKSL